MLRAVELASKLNLSKGRISQLVSAGTLDGCFEGVGAWRRFDPDKVANALNRHLDPGQMLGHGAKTKRAIKAIKAESSDKAAGPEPVYVSKTVKVVGDVLTRDDLDRYELARTSLAEENLRALRLRNNREDGVFVLASEVEQQVAKILAQEIAETEVFVKDCARLLADKLGIDFKVTRKMLTDAWRDHRSGRSKALDVVSDAAVMTDAEQAAQI